MPPGVGEQHQREQPRNLAVAGQQLVDRARQPDRLAAQLDPLQLRARARGVALVEDQVENVQDDCQPFGPFRLGGQLEPRAGGLDPLFRTADALGHRRLGNEERARSRRS
jgi:hypothetical protein